jgi:hypothetical protein
LRSTGIRVRIGRILFLALWLVLIQPAAGAAHALGPTSVSVSSQLMIERDGIVLRWVLDMAEIPTTAIVELMDTDRDGTVSDVERETYVDDWVTLVVNELDLTVDGVDVPMTLISRTAALPTGEDNLLALRVVVDLLATLPASSPGQQREGSFRDRNYEEYVGWREVTVAAGDGVSLLDSTAPEQSPTSGLTVYPPNLGTLVPNSEARFRFVITAQTPTGSGVLPSAEPGDGAVAGGFTIWPTGVLAVVVVSVLTAVAILANRERSPRPGR